MRTHHRSRRWEFLMYGIIAGVFIGVIITKIIS